MIACVMNDIRVQQRLWVRMKAAAGAGGGGGTGACPNLECRVGVGWGGGRSTLQG